MKKLFSFLSLFLFMGFNAYTQWVQIGSDIDAEGSADSFGSSISLSSDGNTVAIGGPSNDGNGPWTQDAGHVRVYRNNNGSWAQLGTEINGESGGDHSGRSICLSANGNIVAIGAPKNDAVGSWEGHVRVFEYTGGNWSQIGSDIDGTGFQDQLGYTLSMDSSGTIVAVSARWNDDAGNNAGNITGKTTPEMMPAMMLGMAPGR